MNELQSLFLEKYDKDPDNNYLLSAPTGSGKTFLAKYVLENREKIAVYVSPLKALAKEVYEDVRQKRKSRYIDSDVYEDDLGSFGSDVLLTTYEKFDSAIRHNYKWLSNVSVVVIDEVHNVETDRGIAIENIVLWSKNNSVPTISLSATLPNIKDYAEWLNADVISYEKRSVPLHECIAYPYVLRCYDNNFDTPLNTFEEIRQTKLQILASVLEYIRNQNKNALIFVKSRRSTEQLSSLLSKFGFKVENYHSGLSFEDRKAVMEALKKGEINFVVATTALGQGVNLPVYATIFYDTSLPQVDERGEFKGWRDLDLMEFKQMAGRAGRPIYDKEGLSIIIATSLRNADELRSKYFTNVYQSKLVNYKPENLSIGVISWAEGLDDDDIHKILMGSLKFKNIDKDTFSTILHKLSDTKLIKISRGIFLTALGKAVSRSYIDIDSLNGFPLNEENFDVLDIISNSSVVLQSMRRCKLGKELLKKWSQGENISTVCPELSAKDLEEIIANARWISFALYRVLKALNRNYEEAFKLYMSIKYGVPYELSKIAELGLDRNTVMELKDIKIKDSVDFCIKAGIPKIKMILKEKGYSAEGICRKYYSNDPSLFEMKRVLEKYYNKEFTLREIAREYGIDIASKLYKMKYIIKNGEKFIVNSESFS